jgi:hypothetical protein
VATAVREQINGGRKLGQKAALGRHVLHAVPVGDRGSDIDHVVIGHGGVYTVNTKTHLIPNVTIKQMPDDVLVLDRMDIPRAFKRAPMRLQPDQVAAIYAAARRATTWV